MGTLQARGLVQQKTGDEDLREMFGAGPVTFYVGFDPTADSLHVGHLIPVMAMAWLQRMGHKPIAVIGGGTAMVGDPSGKTEMRKMLTAEAIEANGQRFREQLSGFLTLDGESGWMLNNADWLMGLGYINFLREIGRHFSVNKMLTAEAYRQRLEKGLSFIEFNYQLLQAYDFLELNRRHGCTLQLGGDDQWGNILAGTDLVRRVQRTQAHGVTQPLILTADGKKMGKTAKGAVWLSSDRLSAFDYFQYWLNVDDRDVGRFLRMYTFMELDEIARYEALKGAQIREAKRVLACACTALVHGKEAAERADAASKAMASGGSSSEMPTLEVGKDADHRVIALLVSAGLTKSMGEGRRLIKNGGVRLDGDKVVDPDATCEVGSETGAVLRVGKKRVVRLIFCQ